MYIKWYPFEFGMCTKVPLSRHFIINTTYGLIILCNAIGLVSDVLLAKEYVYITGLR